MKKTLLTKMKSFANIFKVGQSTDDRVNIRGCSSAGRAPALQAGGQEFESLHLHHNIKVI